ncbi:MAG TPA: SDR family oxidoreductase [Aggregatilinea sp.]|uniref:SDR family oxidoreductase n=1 Tax=Aggregatilinea sp. TaxID=2806333 RepID=UPI002BA80821|nr:SDR family oxidoreductase [Aggregatilinea sp.]HML21360.1 SDR family oxidoreductase [Aggregatilinea sp.]
MRYLVTGANRGIGLELTRQLLGRGEQVFAACRAPERASALQALKEEYGERLVLVPLDVSDPASIAASYDLVRQHADALDVLINNAGISAGSEPLGRVTQEKLLENYRVNAAGPILMAQQYLDLLRAGGAKKIVNLSTGISSIGTREHGGMYSYTASKAGLNMLNKNLSYDVAPYGIVSIVIDPGWVQTDMGGPNAWITPDESVKGILNVVDHLTPSQSGHFFHYSGSEVPW